MPESTLSLSPQSGTLDMALPVFAEGVERFEQRRLIGARLEH
jgi:hypothetical protein